MPVLQRKCACGNHASGGTCSACATKKQATSATDREGVPGLYRSLPGRIKAQVLSDSPAHLGAFNDWETLAPDPDGSHDDEAALALIELGKDPLQPLAKIEQLKSSLETNNSGP